MTTGSVGETTRMSEENKEAPIARNCGDTGNAAGRHWAAVVGLDCQRPAATQRNDAVGCYLDGTGGQFDQPDVSRCRIELTVVSTETHGWGCNPTRLSDLSIY
jgi:hypothetical protein